MKPFPKWEDPSAQPGIDLSGLRAEADKLKANAETALR
jgi:hypothetical protein